MVNKPVKLFFIPFSGGNLYSYTKIKEYLPKQIEFIGLELPGRGKRSYEPLLYDMEQMAEDLFQQVQNKTKGKYMIFGHSLGAVLGLLLCRKLQDKNFNPPSFLFLSGHKAASLCHPMDEPELSNEELVEMIQEMEGTPMELLKDKDFIDYFTPILKADFNAIANYNYNPAPTLRTSIVVLYGRNEMITENELIGWKAETIGPCSIHEFDGGHFFIFNQTKEVCNLIVEKSSEIILS